MSSKQATNTTQQVDSSSAAKQQRTKNEPTKQVALPGQVLQRAYADPGSLSAPDVQTLQRTIGNRATIQLLRPVLQPKLRLGPANDQYEKEADSVANQVVRQIDNPPVQRAGADEEELAQIKPLSVSRVQRSCVPNARTALQRAQSAEEDELAQAKHVNNAQGDQVEVGIETQIQQSRGRGRSLDAGIQRSMEGAFGADFSSVRVHTNAQADTLNRSLNAQAFTSGKDIFFRNGAYAPKSTGGKALLAHELTHVVQQSGGGGEVQARIQRRSDKLQQKSHYQGQAKGGIKIGKTGYDKILAAIGVYHGLGTTDYMGQLAQLVKVSELLTDWEISHGLADTGTNSKNNKEAARRGVLATLKSTDLPLEIQDVYQQAKQNGGQPDIHLLMKLMDAAAGNPGARGQIESDYAAALRSYQASPQDIANAGGVLDSGDYLGAGNKVDNKLNQARSLTDDPTFGMWDTSVLDAPIDLVNDSDTKIETKKKRIYLRRLVPALANMSDEEIKAISAYTEEGPYTDMNTTLRGGSVVSGNNKKERKDNAKKRDEAQQANLMAASGLNRLPDWTGEVLFRGERDISWAGNLTQNRVIMMKSFSSSSVLRSVAEGFAGSGTNSAVWEISNVTTQGKDIRELSLLGSQEGEVLLKPYTRLRIDQVSTGSKYAHHIKATAL
ncbi:DUF4157 domain-containing protein [bacterium]|nr:DUF4157 domain-containing protein [bacterium]